jgi:flagellar motility protein MotE (MotC chaperone)
MKMSFKPNPLLIIGLVFAASFCGRAIALAESAAKQSGGAKKPPAAAHAPVAKAPVEHAPDQDAGAKVAEASAHHEAPRAAAPLVGDPATLLEAIRQRSAALDAREAEVAERERMLDVVEKRLLQRTAELKAVKDDLEKRLVVADTAVSADVTRLAKMYESMKPAKAGEIFNAMDPTFAAGFLTQMTSESAALILANMQTDKAYATSVIIAGRNAQVNKR